MEIMTREQLYELVWSEPMADLAQRLDISDVGLAKQCRRANIPLRRAAIGPGSTPDARACSRSSTLRRPLGRQPAGAPSPSRPSWDKNPCTSKYMRTLVATSSSTTTACDVRASTLLPVAGTSPSGVE